MRDERVRVLLQQNSVAHYRKALYERLAKSPVLDVEFVLDGQTDTPYMPTLSAGELSGVTHLAPVRKMLGGRFPMLFWQGGAVLQAIRGHYDAVIALGSPYSLTTWALLLTRPIHGARILLWTHGLLEPEQGPKWWVRAGLYRLADGLLLYGERAQQLLVEQGLSSRGLRVIYNSLDDEALHQHLERSREEPVQGVRDQLGCGGAERVLLFVGRLQPVKRLDLVLSALAELTKRSRRVHAILVGEGAEEGRLRRLAVELGVEAGLHWVGPCHDEAQLARYFRAADACVIPSGAGLTVIHSLAYATPVVTHDEFGSHFPEAEALEAKRTGFLFPRGDLSGLVDALEACLYPVSKKEQLTDDDFAPVWEKYSSEAQGRNIERAVLSLGRRAS